MKKKTKKGIWKLTNDVILLTQDYG